MCGPVEVKEPARFAFRRVAAERKEQIYPDNARKRNFFGCQAKTARLIYAPRDSFTTRPPTYLIYRVARERRPSRRSRLLFRGLISPPE